jgi:hypothetical protein
LQIIIATNNGKNIWGLIRPFIKQRESVKKVNRDSWVTYFKNIFSQNKGKINVCNDRDSFNTLDVMNPILDKKICPAEIELVLNKLKKNKSGGCVGIPNEFWVEIGKSEGVVEIISEMSNLIVSSENAYPEEWRKGIILPIYKNKGNLANVVNYRGITLLPTIRKIYLRILELRIREWMDINNILSIYQFGFRRNYSTIDCTFVLQTLMNFVSSRKRRKLYIDFIDLEKAFDRVDRELLWRRLREIGLSKVMLRALMYVYRKTYCQVVEPHTFNTCGSFKSEIGLRQGCVTSPVLFTLYLDQLTNILRRADTHPSQVNSIEILLLLFADDIALISQSVVGLQRALNSVEKFCKDNNLQFNNNKTKMMVCSKGNKFKKSEKWYMDSK